MRLSGPQVVLPLKKQWGTEGKNKKGSPSPGLSEHRGRASQDLSERRGRGSQGFSEHRGRRIPGSVTHSRCCRDENTGRIFANVGKAWGPNTGPNLGRNGQKSDTEQSQWTAGWKDCLRPLPCLPAYQLVSQCPLRTTERPAETS